MPRNDNRFIDNDYKDILDILTDSRKLRWLNDPSLFENDKHLMDTLHSAFNEEYIKITIYAIRNQRNYIKMMQSIKKIPNIKELIKQYA